MTKRKINLKNNKFFHVKLNQLETQFPNLKTETSLEDGPSSKKRKLEDGVSSSSPIPEIPSNKVESKRKMNFFFNFFF